MIIHGYLSFLLQNPEDNRIFRTLGKGVLPLPLFRLRKAGSSRISARKVFIPDGPVLIRHPWLRSTFQGHPCP